MEQITSFWTFSKMSIAIFVLIFDNLCDVGYSLLHKNCDFLPLKLETPYKDFLYKVLGPVPTLYNFWSCGFSNICNFLYTGRFSEKCSF